MIPRLKPYIGYEEFLALFSISDSLEKEFEGRFADKFKVKHAIAFPYGRSALWAFLQAMGIHNCEIVQPAYTCSVVAHATVLSGNIPRFVDINLDDYNMDLSLLSAAINENTRVVVPTHLFGTPMDLETVGEIVQAAEQKFSQKIFIIQDCAHSFEAEWKGRSVIRSGDGALFGLNISKQITSIFGGMFTTDDESIFENLTTFRENKFAQKNWKQKLIRGLYLAAVYPAFNNVLYGLTYWLQEKTSFLENLTDAYHLDDEIHFPPDAFTRLADIEAGVGIAQLEKYEYIKKRRREIAKTYLENLRVPDDWVLPPNIPGTTWSHFVIRVPNRRQVMDFVASRGVQLGQLIEYSVPHMPAYQGYGVEGEFDNSLQASQSTINLPIHPGLKSRDVDHIIKIVNSFQ